MKSKFVFIIISLFVASCMPISMTYKNVTFEPGEFVKIYEVPGSKIDLYYKSLEWMVSAFGDAKSVVQFTNKEDGIIIGKYLMFGTVSGGQYGITTDSRVYAKILITVKDGKARLEVDPDFWKYDVNFSKSFTKEKAIAALNDLAESFHKTVSLNKEF